MSERPQQKRGSITVVAALSIAALLIAFVYQVTRGEESQETDRVIVAPPSFIVPLPEDDSDGDGIPDWQETLIGTDPNNPDTDGDGVKDTYTSISYEQEDLVPGADSATAILSPADEISQRLISEYTSLKQSGAYNEERGVRIGENLAASMQQVTPFEPRTLDDIQTDANTSYERAIIYRSAMQDTLAPLLSLNEAEFVIYGRFAQDNDREALSEFADIASIYREAADQAADIVVPTDAAQRHLDVVNALSFYAAVLENMVRYSYDPVASITLLRTYAEADQYLLTTFNTLSSYYVLKYQERYGG